MKRLRAVLRCHGPRLCAALLLVIVTWGMATAAPTPPTIAALPPAATAGRGVILPFVEYEAENAATNGELIGPGRTFTTIEAEASGRRAVRLDGPGEYVEFTLARDANAIVIRYAIPDSADGKGLDATLGVYVDGERIGTLNTTSRYGWFYGRYPFTNDPADGLAHHFYDEARLLLGRTLPTGARVRLMIGPQDRAAWYVVDLADFELVPPPVGRPAGSLSVTDFGADPTGRRDSTDQVRRAVAAASEQGRPLWLPPGRFTVNGHVLVDRVTIAGAGPWYSILSGDGVGLYGRKAPESSVAVTLRDFAIFGEVTDRQDDVQVNAIGGAMGGGSVISNLWIGHVKVGLWFDGPMDGIRISGLRITDVTADGLNFHRGVSNAVMENSFVRNTGDDALAAWSGGQADRNVIFRNNTVIAPILANGIAIYGGENIAVSGNVVADTLTQGGGIHVGNRFKAVPVASEVRITDNIIIRGGSFDPNWRFGVGALWFYALDAPIDARILVRSTDIVDSSEVALHFIGKAINGVALEDVRIDGARTHAIQLQSAGSATLSDVVAAAIGAEALLQCDPGFEVKDLGGNSGLDTRTTEGC